MVDVHKPEIRSKNMRAVRPKDTRPELIVRRAIHARGFRYRLHARDLPGSPDLVLPKYRSVIFIHGCFWHGHNCPMFKTPATNTDFWISKIERNKANDLKFMAELLGGGWRVAVVWECALKGRGSNAQTAVDLLEEWLLSERSELELRR
ncbi:DNA mismatch endonuclease Vsr [Herbaspirillum sp. 1130]|uniref:very short patch repair endonuclease n=1 Tax=Herbaspirillum sp. 1130 TaxID=2806562 RepID=UPI001AE3DCF5|nr:DNA mismatch endonuclease Vsr [Herbaspirillum sp. 1130]MBP1315109.1 DNA mismatch endonuclease (patch repair protein) [Herbaspirillum sp. 1130]